MIKNVWGVLTTGERIRLLIVFGMVGVGSVLELLGVSIFSPLITVITTPSVIDSNKLLNVIYCRGGFKDSRSFLTFLVLVIIVIYIVKNLYLIWEKNVVYRFTYNVQRRISVKLLRSYMSQPYSFFLTHNTAVLQRSLQSDTEGFVKAIKHFIELAIEIITCIAIILYLFIVSHSITIMIAVIMGGTGAFFASTTRKKTRRLGKESQAYKARIYQYMNQALGGVKEIKILGREDSFLQQYDGAFKKYTYASRVSEIIGIMPKYCVEAGAMTGMLIAILIKMFWGQKELMDFVPQLSVFAIASFRLLPSVGRINQYYTWLLYEQPSIDLVYHDLEAIDTMEENIDVVDTGWKLKDCIRIVNVTYHYPNTEQNVLNNVSLTIRKGTTVALIGASGSGKSTLADIMLGLLTPQIGKIYADELDVLKNIRTWQREIGYIPQTIYLSDDTIRHNIAFGISEDDICDKRVQYAAEQAQLAEFINILPEGYDTFVGDRGVRLSGGQRQRLGIARALYNDPEVLILDEATSALDNETESAVMDAINCLHGKKTLIIIAHRLSTISQADEIYEVKESSVNKRDKKEVLGE